MIATSRTIATRRLIKLGILFLVALPLFGLRCYFREADSPNWFGAGRVSFPADEGYKTWSAWNQATFPDEVWPHQLDEYQGWKNISPLTHVLFLLAFEKFGPALGSTRLVSSLWFALFILGFIYGVSDDYRYLLILIGIAALSLSASLFFVSRTATLEQPTYTLLYLTLFLLRRHRGRPPIFGIILISAAAMLSTFLLSRISVLYYLPIMAGILLSWALADGFAGRRKWIIVGGLVFFCAALIIVWQRLGYWKWSVSVSMYLVEALLSNPLMTSDSAIVAAGMICASSVLVMWPGGLLAMDSYFSGLLVLVAIGPICVGILGSEYPQNFFPLLPAFALLALEWAHKRVYSVPVMVAMRPLRMAISVFFLSMSLIALFQLVNTTIIIPIHQHPAIEWFSTAISPNGQRGEPGLNHLFVAIIIGPLALLLAFTTVMLRKKFMGKELQIRFSVGGEWAKVISIGPRRALISCVYLLASFWVLDGASSISSFLAKHMSERYDFARDMEASVPAGSVIAGDWAPLLTLGTGLRSLYVSRSNNFVTSILIQPDYVLFSDTDDDNAFEYFIEELKSARLGEVVLRTTYGEQSLTLYRLIIDDQIWQPWLREMRKRPLDGTSQEHQRTAEEPVPGGISWSHPGKWGCLPCAAEISGDSLKARP